MTQDEIKEIEKMYDMLRPEGDEELTIARMRQTSGVRGFQFGILRLIVEILTAGEPYSTQIVPEQHPRTIRWPNKPPCPILSVTNALCVVLEIRLFLPFLSFRIGVH